MTHRSIVVFVAALALVTCGCSSSHRASPQPESTTTASSTAPATSTTAPASVPAGGCPAETNPDRATVTPKPGAWIQMVSSHQGFAVMGRSVVETVDGQHWTPLYHAPDDLSYVDAIDAAHVWVVGSHSVFASSDGGGHWTMSSGTIPIETVHFVNAALGWAVGRNSLLTTSDGGTSWRSVSSPCPVDRVCFDDAQHGWIATHTNIYATRDGGAHWSLALAGHDPSAVNGVALDVQCAPDHSSWILFDGLNHAMGHDTYIGYRCAAGGACRPVVRENSYSPAVPGIDGPGTSPGPFSVVDAHTAVFVGFTGPLDQPMSMMLVGDDGRQRGATLVVPDGPPAGEPRAVSFVSRDRGWIVDVAVGAAHILATTDGGKTWTRQYSMAVG